MKDTYVEPSTPEGEPQRSTDELAKVLSGSWQLVGWTVHYADGRPSWLPFGKSPAGFLIYTHDGYMAACVGRRQRAEAEDEAAKPAGDFFAYSGRYRGETDAVIHLVDVASDPKMIGTVQHREAVLNEERLTLRAVDAATGRIDQIEWQRARRYPE